MKVLIADNSKMVCERLTAMLSQNSEVEIVGEVNDLSEMIKKVRSIRPEVVIFDIKAPGFSGIEILNEIKNNSGLPIIVMLSNYSYPRYRQRCLEAGADFFFDKSIDIEGMTDFFNRIN